MPASAERRWRNTRPTYQCRRRRLSADRAYGLPAGGRLYCDPARALRADRPAGCGRGSRAEYLEYRFCPLQNRSRSVPRRDHRADHSVDRSTDRGHAAGERDDGGRPAHSGLGGGWSTQQLPSPAAVTQTAALQPRGWSSAAGTLLGLPREFREIDAFIDADLHWRVAAARGGGRAAYPGGAWRGGACRPRPRRGTSRRGRWAGVYHRYRLTLHGGRRQRRPHPVALLLDPALIARERPQPILGRRLQYGGQLAELPGRMCLSRRSSRAVARNAVRAALRAGQKLEPLTHHAHQAVSELRTHARLQVRRKRQAQSLQCLRAAGRRAPSRAPDARSPRR